MKKKTIIIISFIVIALILCGLYLHYENTKLQVSNYNIINNNIPVDLDNYKIVQISDFHNTKSDTLTNDLIKEVKKQKPNIIVITGDIVDSRIYDLQIVIDFIEKIKDVAPIYFVSGNHEISSGKYEEIKDKLTLEGVIILDNAIDKVTINDECIYIVGLVDSSYYPSELREITNQTDSDLKDLIKEVDDEDSFKILLSHRPEIFETYVANDIDVVFTGHAHGGQIRLPFIGGLIAPNQGLFPKYTSGLITENETSMVVSRGIGNSIIPFRINNRPELVVIKLNKE